jgi:hypothetical protein
MGISGDALAALLAQGSNTDISSLIQSGQVSQFAALFNQRAALQGSVGAAAGQQAYGAQFAAADRITQVLSADLRRTEAQLAKQTGRLEKMQAALERMERDAPERTGDAVGRRINDSSAGAQQDNRNRVGARRG